MSSLLTDLPLADLDQRATGAEVPWFRQGFASPSREDPYWAARDFSADVSRVRAPVQFVGGWYDFLLPWMLEDFVVLQAAGRDPQLLIGPWTHTAPGLVGAGHRDGIAWLRSHLLGDDRLPRRAPVRLLVTGERSGGGWRDFSSWPPARSTERQLWIGPNRSLVDDAPTRDDDQGYRYRYDPADPTPSIGGPVLLARQAVQDNRGLEARPDVLTFDTRPLAETQEAIGPAWVVLWVRADSEYFDLFARVCDVDPLGVSLNVCDALVSVAPGEFQRDDEGTWRVSWSLWAIGHRFAAGHRIRLQVSSGAHPRYARNPGTGEDRTTATELRPVQVQLRYGGEHPSALVLPASGA